MGLKLGNCFYDTAIKITEAGSSSMVLVHGTPRGTGEHNRGKRYPHAWIEMGDMVWDPNVDFWFPISRYYELGNIEDKHCIRYGSSEAKRMVVETGHTGPWDKRLKRLGEKMERKARRKYGR